MTYISDAKYSIIGSFTQLDTRSSTPQIPSPSTSCATFYYFHEEYKINFSTPSKNQDIHILSFIDGCTERTRGIEDSQRLDICKIVNQTYLINSVDEEICDKQINKLTVNVVSLLQIVSID